jgi:Holliday junction resolvase
VSYLTRLHDAAVQLDSGLYALTDPVFGLWLKWRRPGGSVLPMTLIGDEAEQAVARTLSSMGFELVYQSKGSRGAFDLLALRGSLQLGVQVKRSEMPLRFNKHEWSRMVADGKRFKWSWVVAAVNSEGTVTILDHHGLEWVNFGWRSEFQALLTGAKRVLSFAEIGYG